ncbi:MAG: response regulator [Paenibacillaceae bacterium]
MYKLMIVDDEPIILNGLRHMIGKFTWFSEIVGASDGIDALEKMNTFKPDLLITDIHMPEMDGLELIRQAKVRNVDRFIVLTGYDVFDYARQALRLNVIDYLLKPIKKDELYDALERIHQDWETERKAGSVDALAYSYGDAEEQQNHITKCLSYIQNHFTRDISLDEVAEHMGLHPNYLSYLIKKMTTHSFVHHVSTFRVQKAKEILERRPSLALDQVSRNVGYENPRHFYKVFKKYEGTTPGEYRSQVTGQLSL